MSCEDGAYLVVHDSRGSDALLHLDDIDPDTGERIGDLNLTGKDITATFTHVPSSTAVALGIGTGIAVATPETGDILCSLDWTDVETWTHGQQVTLDVTVWSAGNLPLVNFRALFEVRAG